MESDVERDEQLTISTMLLHRDQRLLKAVRTHSGREDSFRGTSSGLCLDESTGRHQIRKVEGFLADAKPEQLAEHSSGGDRHLRLPALAHEQHLLGTEHADRLTHD